MGLKKPPVWRVGWLTCLIYESRRFFALLPETTEHFFAINWLNAPALDVIVPAVKHFANLIDEYETRRYPIPNASPRQTLRHLMEARDLTQKDLWKVFGSKGIASEVLHGKRAISRTQAKKLADFFHVGVELFI